VYLFGLSGERLAVNSRVLYGVESVAVRSCDVVKFERGLSTLREGQKRQDAATSHVMPFWSPDASLIDMFCVYMTSDLHYCSERVRVREPAYC
jgi:hypothetical protein